MNRICTPYPRMNAASPRRDDRAPGGAEVNVSRHPGSRRGRWLGGAAAAALVLLVLLQGGRPPSDTQEVAWLNRLAAAGNPDAQLQLALAYQEGRYGLTSDAGAGHYWLEKAARNGQKYAAELLESGQPPVTAAGSPVTGTPAQSRLDALAAQLKSPTLVTVSALWNILGLGLIGSQSSDALQRQAQAGDPVAEFQLGMRYRDGAWGVTRNPARALYWLKRSAADGDPLAMKVLADVYRHGDLGAAQDLDKAAQWQLRATTASGPHG
jgi:TPR repeat protein